MKTISISIIMALVGFGLAYVIFSSNNNAPSGETKSAIHQYTCGMHPEIISDEPGYCPLCSMKLTPKKDGGISSSGITIDPITSQNMGIVLTAVESRQLEKKINSFGKVAYAEPNIHTINLKVEGWVEKLYADETGIKVTKNQALFEIYSPKLITAQEEYINAKKQAERNPSNSNNNILKAAKKHLMNWDISNDEISKLNDASDIKRTMTIRSSVDGIIITKHITDGDFAGPGKELYRVVDLSTVWVKAYIYEQDTPYISLGQIAEITIPSLPGYSFSSKIDYISPFLNSKRQIEIRFKLNNPDNLLKPEMYAEVSINSQLDGERLVVPYSAVIHSGIKEIVYVKSGEDSYSPRIISTGVFGDNDLIEVVSGIFEGELIVTSGQFMLDSESRLNEALADGSHVGHNHSTDTELHSDEFDSDEFVATGGHDIHTCPMSSHYNQLQYGEGDCSKCGMKLVPLEETDNNKVYVCPMTECGIVQDHKGTCSVCGMNLVRYQAEDSEDSDVE